jgi:hypothetical protein
MVAIYRFFVFLAVLTGGDGIAIPARPWAPPMNEKLTSDDVYQTGPDTSSYRADVSPTASENTRVVKNLKLTSGLKDHSRRSLDARRTKMLRKRSIKSFFAKIKKGFQDLGHKIKEKIIDPIGKGIKKAATAVYDKVIKPVGEGIKKAAVTVYNKAIKPAGEWIKKNAVLVGTTLGGIALDIATLGIATPFTAALTAANVVRTAVTVGKGIATAVKVSFKSDVDMSYYR